MERIDGDCVVIEGRRIVEEEEEDSGSEDAGISSAMSMES